MPKPSRAQLDIDAQVYRKRVEIAQLNRQRNALAPICQLPPEILGRVFYFSFPNPLDTSRRRMPAFLRTIAPMHVSHEWRSVALGTYYLWTSFEVGCTRGSSEWGSHKEVVDFVWERCRGALVSLSLRQLDTKPHPPSGLYEVFATKIHEDPGRFKSLSIGVSSGSQDVKAIFPPGRTLVFDALQTLTIATGYGSEVTVAPGDLDGLYAARAPCLRRITLCGMTPVVWGAPLVQSALMQLTELTVVHRPASGSYSDLFSVLSAAPQLREIRLALNSPFDRKDRQEVPDASVELMALRTIHLDAQDPKTLVDFLCKIKVDKQRLESLQLHHRMKEWVDYNEGFIKRFLESVRHTFHNRQGKESLLAPAAMEIQDAGPGPGGLAAWSSVNEYRRNYAGAHCGYPDEGAFSDDLEASIWVSPPELAGLYSAPRVLHTGLSFDRLTYLTMHNYHPWRQETEEAQPGESFAAVLAFGCPALETVWCARHYVTKSFLEGLVHLCGDENERRYGGRVSFPALRQLRLAVDHGYSTRWERIAVPRRTPARAPQAETSKRRSRFRFLGSLGSGSTSQSQVQVQVPLEDPWAPKELDCFNSAVLNVGEVLAMRRERMMIKLSSQPSSSSGTGQRMDSSTSKLTLDVLNIYASQDPGVELDGNPEYGWSPLHLDDRVLSMLSQVSDAICTRYIDAV